MIPVTGKLVFGFHCFIVKTGRHTILIDSCIGNDKERPTRPQFHRLRTPAPGHTPGNVVIHASSRDERAVFLGDRYAFE